MAFWCPSAVEAGPLEDDPELDQTTVLSSQRDESKFPPDSAQVAPPTSIPTIPASFRVSEARKAENRKRELGGSFSATGLGMVHPAPHRSHAPDKLKMGAHATRARRLRHI